MIALFCMLMLIMHMANLNLYYLFYKKKYNYLFSLLVSLFLIYHNNGEAYRCTSLKIEL